MQSVSISIFNGSTYPISYLTVPVLNQDRISLHVQNFLNEKNETKKEKNKQKMSECRKLFQKNNCELFAFPSKRSLLNVLSCGKLFFCPFFQNTGVVLCFFPVVDTTHFKQIDVATSIFNGPDYPEFNDPFTAFFSLKNVSFLIFEEGSINTNTDNNCTLSGVEFMVLKYNGVRPTLLCKKTDDRKVEGSSILVKEVNLAHQTNEKYIFINCLSEEKGFCISLKFPILTEQSVKEKILHAQMLRSKNLNATCLNSQTDICQSTIFQTNTNCLFFLPIEICLNLPFNGLTGGKVYFFCKEDNFLQIAVWSDFFELGNKPTFGYNRSSSTWQVDKLADIFRYSPSFTKIFTLQDPHLKFVQVGDCQCLLKNAKMQFVFKDRSLGIFFLRTKEQDQSSQAGEMAFNPSSMQSSTSQSFTCIADPQVGSSRDSIGEPYAKTESSQSSLSQTSSWTTNSQVDSPKCSMNLPYTQSSFHPQPSLSQTSSWMINPQIGSSQEGSMGISYTQTEKPPHASMQILPFYTEGLPIQGALNSNQLTLENIDQISAEIWEQLNVILQDVSTNALLEILKDAENS